VWVESTILNFKAIIFDYYKLVESLWDFALLKMVLSPELGLSDKLHLVSRWTQKSFPLHFESPNLSLPQI